MASMDAFNADVFSTREMTGKVEKIDYKPQMLGELGIFHVEPVTSKKVFVDRVDGKLQLIQSSPEGAPPSERERDSRSAVALETVHLSRGRTIYAAEVAGVRAFGSTSELESLEAKILKEQARLVDDLEVTEEHHRFAALHGKLLDADGSVIYDYFAEFDVAEAPVITIALNTATTKVRTVCNQAVRGMAKSSKGAFVTGTSVHALAGDEFFDKLTDHDNVRRSYENWAAAADLRESGAFGAFTYGGITFHNYRGMDGGEFGVATDEARLFPVGARDVFVKAQSPLATEEYVNTPGMARYSMLIRDRDRGFWVRPEVYANPLYLCQLPDVLRTMKIA